MSCGSGSDNLEDIGNNFLPKILASKPKPSKNTSIVIEQTEDTAIVTSSLKSSTLNSSSCCGGGNSNNGASDCCGGNEKSILKSNTNNIKSSCCGGNNKSNNNNSDCCSSDNKNNDNNGECCSNKNNNNKSDCCDSSKETINNKNNNSSSSCCGGNDKSNSSCCKSNDNNDSNNYNNNNNNTSSSSSCCSGNDKSNSSCCKSNDNNNKSNKINDDSNIIASSAVKVNQDNIVVASTGCPSETPNAGSEQVCNGCPGQQACKSQADNPDKKSIEIRMKVIKNKILVMSSKGGVGKSTVSSLLSYGLSKRNNQKVSVLDVDICGPSIPKLMGVDNQQIINSEYGWVPPKTPNHEIKVMSVGFLLGSPDAPVVWKGPRKTTMIRRFLKDTFWGKQDWLVIDTPPGTSDEHLSIINSLKTCSPDGAILVTTPQDLSVDTVKKEIDLCRELKVPIIGIIENLSGFVCPCCDEITEIFKSDGGKKLAEQYNIPFLGKIPIDTNLGQCAENGKCSICEFSESPGTKSIQSIIEKIELIINENKKRI